MFAFRTSRRIQRWVVAGIVGLISTSNAVAQTTLVDTGSGSASGGYALFNDGSDFNFLGGQFSVGSDFTIGTIQIWMVRPSGSLVIKLRANSGSNLPGAELATATYPMSFAGFTAQWTTFGSLSWSQPAGTYWITVEPEVGTDFGSMPGSVPTPLPATAYYTNGNPGWVLNSPGDALGKFGFRVYTPAPPAPINVPGDEPTIQDAIDAAVMPAQEIVVAPGTYSEAIAFSGKTVIVRANGNASNTIIDATGTNQSAVTIGSGSSSGTRLEGFTITGGSTAFEGGGVWVGGATALIKNCVITGNSADSGGGAAAEGGANATFENCTFEDNACDTAGGGAYLNNATAAFTGCTFTSNASDADAGGIDVNNNGTATVTNCTFQDNSAGNAGGAMVIIGSGASAAVSGSTFTNNTALQAGGVMANIGGGSFTNCNFIDNHATIVGATGGGGMQVQGTSAVTISGCEFRDNDAAYGAGVQFLAFSGTASITGCTFKNNVASISGGGYYRGFGGSGTPSVGTTLFCGNTPDNIAGSYVNNGGNTLNASCNAPGDVNGDGHVNVADLLAVITVWGACPAPPAACPSDMNGDGLVNVADLLTVIAHWG